MCFNSACRSPDRDEIFAARSQNLRCGRSRIYGFDNGARITDSYGRWEIQRPAGRSRIMGFRFKKKESVAKAVRRLCCERLDVALKNLEGQTRFEAVHNVRREIKKLRALLRLMRQEVGKNVYRKRTKALREVAKLLTALRDARVKMDAFNSLTTQFRRKLPAQPFPAIQGALHKNCLEQENKLFKGRSIASARKILRDLKQRLENLKVESAGWTAICPGLKASYYRGREVFRAVRREASPENFHQWRKRVKDLWFQLRLLGPAWPRELRAEARELEILGEILGDDHDLFLLRQFVEEQYHGAEKIEWLISLRQEELRSRAMKLGARFYSEKPSRFCSRIENYWKIWKKET